MRVRSILYAAAAAMLLAAPASAQQAASPVQPAPIKRTVLSKVEVPGSNYEVVTAMVEAQAGFKAGRHSHPGHVTAQVLEGEFMVGIDGQPEKILKTGETGEVPSGAIHVEGAVGSKPAKLIAIYVVEKGKPLVQPAP